MSLHLEFEPHSWYMGAAIREVEENVRRGGINRTYYVTKRTWEAYYLNGMTGYIETFEANALKELKQQIKEYLGRDSKRWAEAFALAKT